MQKFFTIFYSDFLNSLFVSFFVTASSMYALLCLRIAKSKLLFMHLADLFGFSVEDVSRYCSIFYISEEIRRQHFRYKRAKCWDNDLIMEENTSRRLLSFLIRLSYLQFNSIVSRKKFLLLFSHLCLMLYSSIPTFILWTKA